MKAKASVQAHQRAKRDAFARVVGGRSRELLDTLTDPLVLADAVRAGEVSPWALRHRSTSALYLIGPRCARCGCVRWTHQENDQGMGTGALGHCRACERCERWVERRPEGEPELVRVRQEQVMVARDAVVELLRSRDLGLAETPANRYMPGEALRRPVAGTGLAERYLYHPETPEPARRRFAYWLAANEWRSAPDLAQAARTFASGFGWHLRRSSSSGQRWRGDPAGRIAWQATGTERWRWHLTGDRQLDDPAPLAVSEPRVFYAVALRTVAWGGHYADVVRWQQIRNPNLMPAIGTVAIDGMGSGPSGRPAPFYGAHPTEGAPLAPWEQTGATLAP